METVFFQSKFTKVLTVILNLLIRSCGCVERCVNRRTEEGERMIYSQKTLQLPRSLKCKLDAKNREYVFFYRLIKLRSEFLTSLYNVSFTESSGIRLPLILQIKRLTRNWKCWKIKFQTWKEWSKESWIYWSIRKNRNNGFVLLKNLSNDNICLTVIN